MSEAPREPGPAGLDHSRGVLVVPALVSLGVLGLAGLSTYADPGRRWVGLVAASQPDALPAWWATVLYVLVALVCLSRARAELAGPAGRVRRRLAAVAWLGLGSLLTVLSVDHVLGVHRLVAGDPRLTALPGPVAAHPVQAVLVALALPVVVVLLVLTGGGRGLLVVAGALYAVSGVVLDQRLLQPSWNQVRVETLELAFEWAGALVLVAAATRSRGSAGWPPGSAPARRWRRRPGRTPG